MFNQILEIIKMNKLLIFSVAAMLSFVSVEGCASAVGSSDEPKGGIMVVNNTGNSGVKVYRYNSTGGKATVINGNIQCYIPVAAMERTGANAASFGLRVFNASGQQIGGETEYVFSIDKEALANVGNTCRSAYCFSTSADRKTLTLNKGLA